MGVKGRPAAGRTRLGTCSEPGVAILATRKPSPRLRGIERRKRLLDAAWDLLATQELDTVSLADVARRARVPVGSAYHFYDNIRAVYEALAERVAGQLLVRHRSPLRRRPRRWSDVVEELIDRGVGYFSENPAARQLLIGPHTPPELKFRDRQQDRLLAEVFERQIDAAFRLPPLPDRAGVFYRALEIADLMLCLSMVEHGSITVAMTDEAKRACTAYLASYLPAVLPRRPPRPVPPSCRAGRTIGDWCGDEQFNTSE